MDVGVGQRAREALEAAVVAAQGADRGGRAAGLLDRVRDRAGQHRVRAELDEQARAVREQALERRRELHRLAQVAVPVAPRRARRCRSARPSTRRVERDLAADGRDRRQVGEQPVLEQLDLRRSARRSRPGSGGPGRPRRSARRAARPARRRSPATTVLRGPLTAAIDRPLGAGEPRSVSTSSATDAMPPCPARPSAIAWLRSATTRAASSQRQRARDAGGGDLALRVADHRVGLDALGAPQRGQRHHHREQRRLHDVDAVERRRARPVSTSRSDQSTNGAKRGLARVDPGRRTPAIRQQLRRPCPPTASPGPGTRTRRGRTRGRRRAAARRVPPAISASRPRAAPSASPATTAARSREVGAAGGQREPDVGERRGARGEVLAQPLRLRNERRAIAAGERPDAAATARAPASTSTGARSGGLDRRRLARASTWRVRAADAPNDGHARAPRSRPPGSGQASASLSRRDLSRRPVDVRGSARRRAASAAARSCRSARTILITPATPAAAGRVADVGLQRAEPQRPGSALRAVGRDQRLGLDRVAQRPCRCRAPRRRPRRPARARRRPAPGGSRAPATGPLGAVRPFDAPSWLTARAADHGQHLVAVAARVGEPLEQRARRRPRRSPVPSAPSANDLQRPSGDSARWRANATSSVGVAITRHAAGQRQRAFALAQRLARQVQRDQRRRARRVDR